MTTPDAHLRYVYAVCRPLGVPLRAGLTGVAGAPPRELAHRGLVAVVGDVPERDFAQEPLRARLEDLDFLAATARAHEHVVTALARVTTPLPLRLVTVFRDDDAVRALLEEQADLFRARLDRLCGRVEWGVKVYLEPAPEEPEPARDPDRAERTAAPTGRDYLRRRSAARTAHEETLRRAERVTQDLHADLAGRSAATRLHRSQPPELAGTRDRNTLNAAYLVDRSRSAAFVKHIGTVADRLPGLRVELTGPWAGYSFTGETEDEGDAA
ncbi:GvpL/GvpF family gas vesicle protein [Streptomyces xanthii]|uniref:GvpL/GvpF family gas vesicle protein n=1 Tax=Streptomyces xanthii TaxID=2768069 RepID=A0A7H1B3F6_9ACTN|nr:GvpL/GvpF family gas vesicle protein [Streptomyces xanthii]QNS03261.1 GvpL/GvpF family gas vesicle protein [Streptomyces xanthii]